MSTTSATINGISYTAGKTFKARVSATGKAASDGTGSSSTITAGSTYCFVKYNAGASYPYAIGTGSSTTVRCWVKATVFPYATYTVAYNANGGSGAPSSQTKTYGTNLTLSSTKPTRTGYTFKGWATSSSSSTVAYSAGGTYTANKAITLYAVWSAISYYVKFNANGGSGSMSNQTHTYGSSKALTANAFTRTGYTFAGWATSSSGSVKYSNKESVKNLSSTSGATVNLYAVWTANSYTVKFNANGGSGSMSDESFTYGTAKKLTTNTFTRTGYTFAGWATSSSGSVAYTDAQSVSNLTSTSGGTVTLYAVWTANTYTVTFNASANGGTGSTTKSVTYGNTIGTLPEADRKYYTFAGWFTAAEGGTQISSSTVVTGNVTYYAQFVIDASIYAHNGTELKPGFPYVYSGGEWKKGYAYVYTDGGWQRGMGG